MGVHFSPLEVLYFCALFSLPFFGGLALLCWISAMLLQKRSAGPAKVLRRIAYVSTGVFAAGGLYVLLTLVGWSIRGRLNAVALRLDEQRHTHALTNPVTLADGVLPAGTSVYESDDGKLQNAWLYVPVVFDGVQIKDGLTFSGTGRIQGRVTLVRDQRIEGVPCNAGKPVELAWGRLSACTLSMSYQAFDKTWPAGTYVTRDHGATFFRLPGASESEKY